MSQLTTNRNTKLLVRFNQAGHVTKRGMAWRGLFEELDKSNLSHVIFLNIHVVRPQKSPSLLGMVAIRRPS